MLLFFCCSSGIQSGARFTDWGADQACEIYLQAVYLDNLTFAFSEMRLLICFFHRFSSFWRSMMFLPLPVLQAVFARFRQSILMVDGIPVW